MSLALTKRIAVQVVLEPRPDGRVGFLVAGDGWAEASSGVDAQTALAGAVRIIVARACEAGRSP